MTWRELTLGDCVTLQSGGTPSKANAAYWSGPVPWVSAKDMTTLRLQDTEDHVSVEAIGNGTRLVQKGTLLAVVRGMSLAKEFRIVEVQRPMAFNQDVKAIIPRDGVDSRFILYSLLARREYVLGIADEAAHGTKRLQTDRFLAVPVSLPNLPMQRHIASILSAYDDLIENNTRRIAILEEMARRIYEEWFVRFRFPGHEQVKMVESELGLIPEGWELRRLGDVVELAYGKALKAEERKPGPYPVYGSSGVVGSHDTSLVNGPGIIVGRKGNVGSVHWCDVSFYPIDTVYFVRTELPLHYVFFNLKRQNFINNDAAVPGLNRNQAYSLHFLVPSKVVLGRFVELCGPIFKQLRLLAVKNANLRATRDLLLPKLISGELDVSTLSEPTV
ncbi:restriction endonuclease subunit S [Thauera phenylacetica]